MESQQKIVEMAHKNVGNHFRVKQLTTDLKPNEIFFH
jgi:hypothetical protein